MGVLDPKLCGCGGANPNCCHCYGSGAVSPQLTDTSPRKRSYKRLPRNFRPSTSPTPVPRDKIIRTTSPQLTVPIKDSLGRDEFQLAKKELAKDLQMDLPRRRRGGKGRRGNRKRQKRADKRRHSFQAKREKSRSNPPIKQNDDREISKLIAQDESRKERELDATKGYAHAFRETGRFGSHPSHDDFGDDSNS